MVHYSNKTPNWDRVVWHLLSSPASFLLLQVLVEGASPTAFFVTDKFWFPVSFLGKANVTIVKLVDKCGKWEKAMNKWSPEWVCAVDMGMPCQGSHSPRLREIAQPSQEDQMQVLTVCAENVHNSFLLLDIHGLKTASPTLPPRYLQHKVCSPTESAPAEISYTCPLNPAVYNVNQASSFSCI